MVMSHYKKVSYVDSQLLLLSPYWKKSIQNAINMPYTYIHVLLRVLQKTFDQWPFGMAHTHVLVSLTVKLNN